MQVDSTPATGASEEFPKSVHPLTQYVELGDRRSPLAQLVDAHEWAEGSEPAKKADDSGNLRITVTRLLGRHNVAVDPSLASLMQYENCQESGKEHSPPRREQSGFLGRTPKAASPSPPFTGRVFTTLTQLARHPALSGSEVSEEQLKDALEDSIRSGDVEVETVDGVVRVYPQLKAKRRTVVVRNLGPEDESALQKLLLTWLQSPSQILEVKSVTTTLNAAIYVTLVSEELARDCALWLMTQQLNEKPLQVGIKSEANFTVFKPLPPLPTPKSFARPTAPRMRRRRPAQNNRKGRERRKVPTGSLDIAEFPPLEASVAYNRDFIRYTPDALRAIRDGQK